VLDIYASNHDWSGLSVRSRICGCSSYCDIGLEGILGVTLPYDLSLCTFSQSYCFEAPLIGIPRSRVVNVDSLRVKRLERQTSRITSTIVIRRTKIVCWNFTSALSKNLNV
jgi:hypothetical protein